MKRLVSVFARYGAIAGLLGAFMLVVLYYIGKHPFLIPIYLDFRIILIGVFIFFAMKEYRNVYQGGTLYFWEGMTGSLVFILVFAVLVALIILVFENIDSGFIPSYIKLTEEQIRSLPPQVIERIGKDVVERNLKELPNTNVIELPKLYVFQSFVIGFFISIIISVILRKQPKN